MSRLATSSFVSRPGAGSPRTASFLARTVGPLLGRGRAARRPRHDAAADFAVAAEVCEPRAMLSAVTASVRDGDLNINGSNGNDSLTVSGLGGGRYQVTGSAGTTVNGRTTVVLGGVKDDVRIDARGGNDTVFVRNVNVGGDVILQLGSGNDRLVVQSVAAGDDLLVWLGSGANKFSTTNVSVGDDFRTNGGDGVDDLLFTNMRVADEMTVDLEDGSNTLTIDRLLADDLRIEGGDDRDTMRISNARVADDLRVSLKDGDDSLALVSVIVGDELDLNGGDDFDRLALTNVSAHDRDFDRFEA